MKTLKKIYLFLLCLGLFASCVSSRKYKEAVSARDDYYSRYAALNESYNKLQDEKKSLEASASGKQKQLSEKEAALKAEEEKMREMKSLVDAQRNAIRNLKQQVCNALKCFTPDELTVDVRDGKLYVSMSDKLLFPSGSDIVNSRGKEAISMLAAVLANSDLEIMVEGHTDNVPIHNSHNKDNWDLSVHRATSVSRILIDNGISSQRIIPGGRGEFHPVASNESTEGRQLNRRTEIVLAPKLDKLWKLTEAEDIAAAEEAN